MRIAAVFLLALGAFGCAFPPPDVPLPAGDAQGAGIVVRMTLRGRDFINSIPRHAPVVYFAQRGRDGELMRDNLVIAKMRAGAYLVALDVPPGRYAPVAAGFPRGPEAGVAKLPQAITDSWGFDVRPGVMTFAGDATLIPEEGLNWRALLRFPGAPGLTFTSPRIDKSLEAELPALRAARRRLKGTMWAEPVDRRLKELGNPPEPIRSGFLFKKTVNPTPAGRFGYIDTLGWKKPLKIPGGLLWKGPGDARVDVRFLQTDTTGYIPPDIFLAKLREAGSAEDEHALYNVELTSRTARAARFTTYQYPQSALTGSEVKVVVTEMLYVPDKDGCYYLVRYQARRGDYGRRHALFRRFASYLVFLPPEKKE